MKYDYIGTIAEEVELQKVNNEMSRQRIKWGNFLKSKNLLNSDDQWMWQYWRSEFRTPSQRKRIMQVFSSKIKTQRKVKKLIRRGIPPELRGQIWLKCAGGLEKMAQSELSYMELLEKSNNLAGGN